jgi:hypothetical protein
LPTQRAQAIFMPPVSCMASLAASLQKHAAGSVQLRRLKSFPISVHDQKQIWPTYAGRKASLYNKHDQNTGSSIDNGTDKVSAVVFTISVAE